MHDTREMVESNISRIWAFLFASQLSARLMRVVATRGSGRTR